MQETVEDLEEELQETLAKIENIAARVAEKEIDAYEGFMESEKNPELLLLLRDSSRRKVPTPALLMDVFGITPAEARLTLKLINGLSLTAAAEELGISRNTARTQLSSVFSKTDLNSQTQLVKLVSDTLSNYWL